MANPYDVKYEVPVGDGPINYAGNCYQDGEIISVKRSDFACFAEFINPDNSQMKCFPAYCIGDSGVSPKGFRVPVLVPAGATVEQAVSTIEGCAPPNMVCFHYCANCLYVGYDAEPVIDPSDPIAAAGGGADPNPTCRDLIEHGVCVETLFIHNPATTDVTVTLSYYC